MEAFARQQFELDSPLDPSDPQSITVRQHRRQLDKSRGVVSKPELEPPDELVHVWWWYLDVRNEHALSCQELLAWIQLTKTDPTPFEITLIRMLDETFWRVRYDRIRKVSSRVRD